MDNQSYYRIHDGGGCDVAVTDRHLVVNCAGVCVMSEPFLSHNRAGRQDYYLMVLAQGELAMDVNGLERTVCAGEAVVHPPGQAYRYAKTGMDRLVYFWAHFTGSGAADALRGCGLAAETVYAPGVGADIAEGFAALFRNFIHRDGCFEAAAAAVLQQILVTIRRRSDGGGRPDGAAVRVRESLALMHRKYAEPLAVPALAAVEHLSVSRYCAVFRRCMGVSPQAYLIDLRLNMAAELMLGTDLEMKQIARSVGYDDPLYFSRLFRRRRGISPTRYRQSMGSAAP